MSWLFKSNSSEPEPEPEPNSVKADLSLIGQSLGRQLRGVASFLAPPPSTTNNNNNNDDDSLDTTSSQALIGIRNDLVEIGGSLKSGLSVLSGNKAVFGISRFASSLLQFQNEEEEGLREAVPGIADELVAFVNEISRRPECWTDFPLELDHDFEMSDAQRGHASTIQQLVPSFAALRVKLHSCMSDEQFWMIYFIFLLPRLNEHDFELLSTPKIVEARDILLEKLRNKRNVQVENSENSKNLDTFQEGSEASETQSENNQFQEKESLAKTANAAETVEIDEDENNTEWSGNSVGAQKRLENEEDVSFSDLEDDDNDLSSRLSGVKLAQDVRVSSPSGSSEWVQLNESSETQGSMQKAGQSISPEKHSEGEDSNDWLTVDDFD